MPSSEPSPASVELYREAEKLKDQGDLQGAATMLESLLATDESYALAHSALAVILGRLGRHDEAIQHAQRVCTLEPDDPFSYTALSVTYQRGGKIPEAEEALYQARVMQERGAS